MAARRRFLLRRYGEPLVEGSADEIAAALGVPRARVYRLSERRSPDGFGYEVVALGEPKPCAEEPEENGGRWSPGTSPTLRMLRRRRAELDGYEPKWEI